MIRGEKDKVAVGNSDKSAVGTKWGNELGHVNTGLARELRERQAMHEPRGARICHELIVCPIKDHTRVAEKSHLQQSQLSVEVVHN
jgi:hypothetical protein